MSWAATDDPGAFLAAAGAFLRSRPVEHTLLLTVADGLARRGPTAFGPQPPLLAWWEDGGAARAALVRTPPMPALLSALPAGAVEPLAALLEAHAPLGVVATASDGDRLAAAWRARGGAARAERRQRLHRLVALAPPAPPPPGRAVLARAEHRALLVAWSQAFARELGLARGDAGAVVDDRLAGEALWLWEDAAGEPVAFAGRTRVLAGAVRVAPVYTVPERRGRGYAAGVTAAVCAQALERGAEHVLLFTDLANPVANRLYARLGFAGVEDRVSLALER